MVLVTAVLVVLCCAESRQNATVKFAAEGFSPRCRPAAETRIEVWLMLIVRLTRACRPGHPMPAAAAQPSAANRPVLVHSCCRLGRTANPPSFWQSLTDWLRRAERSHR